jgi:hypothetical protein
MGCEIPGASRTRQRLVRNVIGRASACRSRKPDLVAKVVPVARLSQSNGHRSRKFVFRRAPSVESPGADGWFAGTSNRALILI